MNKKNIKILILDGQYGHFLYRKLSTIKNFSFHIRTNAYNPLKYYKYIIENKPDVIIMNTWYNDGDLQLSKGIVLLEKLALHYGSQKEEYEKSFLGIKYKKKINYKLSNFNSQIIYLCDMGELNKKEYSIFKYFNNIEFVPDKNINTIINKINNKYGE